MNSPRPTITAESAPILLLQAELSEPLPGIPAFDPISDRTYQQALTLIRLHGRPLGMVSLALPSVGLTGEQYADAIWEALHTEIAAHLRADGLEVVEGLTGDGLAGGATHPCHEERMRVLQNAPFISVVICTRDRVDTLALCLRSLLRLDYPRYEVIVVDNAPRSAETADLVAQVAVRAAQVRYVREDRPGLSWARNRGMVEARGELVAFTDDDAEVDPLWLAGVAEGFAASDRVGCVTGPVLPRELETPAQIWFEQAWSLNKGFVRRIFDLDTHRPDDLLYPFTAGRFGSGNNMAFRTAVLREIGGFDPALGAGALAGGEDLAAFFQLVRRGHQLVYEPSALVYHTHRREYAGLRSQLSDGTMAGVMMKCVLDEPLLVFELTAKLPRLLLYTLSPHSVKNAGKGPDFPAELTRGELAGMVRAPFGYLRGRYRARRVMQQFGPIEVPPPPAGGGTNMEVGHSHGR